MAVLALLRRFVPALALLLVLGAHAGLLPGARAQSLQPVPPLQARVTDLTGTLGAGQRQQLEAQLAAIEQRKGAQVVVLMLPTTRPEEIEQYGIRVAEAWKIGRGSVDGKRVDDGVILLVAKDDRKVRIEVGYGLEGAIPDAYARRIIAEAIAPRFREGDFFGGLQAAVTDLGRLIDGEPLPGPWQPGQDAQPGQDIDWLAGLLVVFVGGMIATAVLGRLLGSAAGGAGAGLLAAVKGLPLLLAGIVGVIAFVILLVLSVGGGGGGGGGMRPGRRSGPRGGPVIWTGGGGGWGGGGGFGGGGFRGGGGGFGGGGSSGSW